MSSHPTLPGAIAARLASFTPLSAVLCASLTAALTIAGCGDRRVDDSELGSLVVAKETETITVDVDRAATDIAELRRAIAMPHSAISEALGAHRVSATSSVRVTSGGAEVSKLSDVTTIAFDADGNFAATADNDRDYGRHALFVEGTLYLRPRFGKYHGRLPASVGEPSAIRDEMFSTTSAYFELLYAGIELSDRGGAQVQGRAAREIDFKLSPTPSQRDPESLAHKKWRDSITVESAAGHVSLDEQGGFALAAELSGAITFVKGSKRFTMELTATHKIESIGDVAAVVAPGPEEVVSAPTMSGEVDEQRQLLDGLSPAGDIGEKR